MPHTSPACFRGGAAEAVAGEAAAALVTSVYETCVGIVALSWSRSRLGLSLRVDLFLSPSEEEEEEEEEETLRFRIRPWLLWKRRGSKRFPLKRRARRRRRHFVDLAWDLTKARFSGAAAPEPSAGYFVSVAVDGEVVLVAGDLRGDAAIADPHRHRQTLISRREHVVIGRPGASRTYRTTARLGGREREIAIELREAEQAKAKAMAKANANAKEKERGRGSGEMGMLIMVDGNCVLNVPQLRWTFRGSAAAAAAAAAEGGGRIRVSWDLHNWLFRLRNDSATATTAPESGDGDAGDAVFVFRFERDGNGDTTTKENSNTEEGYFGKRDDDFAGRGYFGKRDRKNWSDSGGCGNNSGGSGSGRGRKKSLVKASSSSSVSSTASTSTTVAGWASPEDAEMQRGDVFSLLVYASRS